MLAYNLPTERIAQRPVHPPHNAKLLIVSRTEGVQGVGTFLDLPKLLSEGDLVILNNTKVLPSRLFGTQRSTGALSELLLLEETGHSTWRAIGKPLKRLKPGVIVSFQDGISCEVLERVSDREIVVRFTSKTGGEVSGETLRAQSTMPIPPYIRNGEGDEEDRIDYQTEYALIDGSIAAPTAGLHVTKEVLSKFRTRGIDTEFLTLHVGPPSFLPIEEDEKGELLPPGKERLSVDPALVSKIKEKRGAGKRVVAIGTTVVRAVESSLTDNSEETELFITPGFNFAGTNTIVTNFHQPRTTHLLLVEAFVGREILASAYDFALKNDFRFLSYGDGMVIL